MTNEKKLSPAEVIHWLEECGSDACYVEQCAECPYNRIPYEDGCGKLLRDAAELLRAAYGLDGGANCDGKAEAAE